MDDEYGLRGLLSIMRNSNPDCQALTLGADLTSLSLNLNAPEPLASKLLNVLEDPPIKSSRVPIDVLDHLPYPLMDIPLRFDRFNEKTLLYIFYSLPRDKQQLQAAQMLHNQGFKYHKSKTWVHEGRRVKFDLNTFDFLPNDLDTDYLSIPI
eukprot:NODE_10_length_61504_cov_0.956502.p42 type:complete len:152 gc:universal NODE_10_length_61504_cov_0.956502:33352-33807(+)